MERLCRKVAVGGGGVGSEGEAVEGMRTSTALKGKSSRKASLFTRCFMTADRMSLLAGSTPPNAASLSVASTLGLQLILFSQWIRTARRWSAKQAFE